MLLTGAGLSVPSGLADYRGPAGTYTLNTSYRPIYHHEFLASHESRKRYWARSFLGFPTLLNSRPNAGHFAIRDLGRMGLLGGVVTQNVDSFHRAAHGEEELGHGDDRQAAKAMKKTVELHGYLRGITCTTCGTEHSRAAFQSELARLNPAWAAFLSEMQSNGALSTEDPRERAAKGLRTNPDGDVELPVAPFHTFRYPACEACVATCGRSDDAMSGTEEVMRVELDGDGAWTPASTTGVLKPAVVMFGESIAPSVKDAAERMVDEADSLLVVGSSLATYSAWRLAKRAKDQGMRIGVVNLGGVRGEEGFFGDFAAGGLPAREGAQAVRVSVGSEKVLPLVVEMLQKRLELRQGK